MNYRLAFTTNLREGPDLFRSAPSTRPLSSARSIPRRKDKHVQKHASSPFQGARRVRFLHKSRQNFARVMREAKSNDEANRTLSSSASAMRDASSFGLSPMVREFERSFLRPDPRASRASFDSAFKQSLRAQAHFLKMLDRTPQLEHVHLATEAIMRLQYSAKCEIRAILNDLNVLNDAEIAARDDLLRATAHVVVPQMDTTQPQMFSTIKGYVTDPIGASAVREAVTSAVTDITGAIDMLGSKLPDPAEGFRVTHAVDFGIMGGFSGILEKAITFIADCWHASTDSLSIIMSALELAFPKFIKDGILKVISWFRAGSDNHVVPNAGGVDQYASIVDIMLSWLPSCLGEPFAAVFNSDYAVIAAGFCTAAFADYKYVAGTLNCALFAIKTVLSYFAKILRYPDLARKLSTDPLVYDATIFMDDFRDRMSDNVSVPTIGDAENVRKFQKSLTTALQTSVLSSQQQQIYKMALDKIGRIAPLTEQVFANSPTHVTPSVTCLLGRPGLGKSFVLEFIIQALTLESLPDDQLNKFEELPANSGLGVFYLNSTSKFFDGLTAQDRVMVLEEFLATKDTGTDPPASVATFTSVVNEMPTHPLMADVKFKGNMPFAMWFVAMTTNVERWSADVLKSMHSPAALVRRVHFPYKVVLDDEFLDPDTGRFDPHTVIDRDEFDGSAFPQRLQPWDLATGTAREGGTITVEDAIQRIIEHRRETSAAYRRKQEAMAARKAALLAARRERPVVPNMASDEEDHDGAGVFQPDLESIRTRWMAKARARYNTLAKGIDLSVEDLKEAAYKALPYAGLLSAALLVVAAAHAVSRPGRPRPNSATVQLKRAVTKRSGKKARSRARLRERQKEAGIEPNGATDEADMNIVDCVMKNSVSVYIGRKHGKSVVSTKCAGHALYIGGRTLVMPQHYEENFSAKYEEWLQGSPECGGEELYVEFRTPGLSGGNPVISLGDCLTRFTKPDEPKMDKIYLNLPRVIKPRRRITHHFADHSSGGESFMAKPSPYKPAGYGLSAVLAKPSEVSYETTTGVRYEMPRVLKYLSNSKIGDCGSVLFARDSDGILKVAGMHVAGSADQCVGYSVTFGGEFDDAIFDAVDAGRDPFIPHTIESLPSYRGDPKTSTLAPTNYEVVARVTPKSIPDVGIVPDVPSYAKDSGKIPVNFKTRLVDGVHVDPILKSRAKYSLNTVVVNAEAMGVAINTVARNIMSGCSNKYPFKELTVYDAMNGIESMNMLKRRSYAGLHESLKYGVTNKVPFMGREGPVDTSAEKYGEFVADCEDMLRSIKEGKPVYDQVFDSIPKAEVLPENKVLEDSKVRLIAASSMTLGVITRVVYGQVHLMQTDPDNVVTNGGAMGMNPYGDDWTKLAHKVISDLPGGKTGGVLGYDFKGYDGSCSVQFMEAAFDVMDQLVPTTDAGIRRVRKWVREQTCYSIHRSGSEIIQMTGSNPSGNYMTTIINDIIQKIAIFLSVSRYTMLHRRELVGAPPLVPAKKYTDSEELFEEQAMVFDYDLADKIADLYDIVTYGDDGLLNVASKLKIDTKLLARCASYYGFHMTNGDKTDPETNPMSPSDIREVSFLKRGFRFDGVRYWAPLELQSIFQSMGWKSKNSTDEDRSQVFPNALLEFAIHGKEVYEVESAKAYERYREQGRDVTLMTFDEAYNRALRAKPDIY